ncbi:MAG: glycosyl hydrolase family 28-related protein [Chitinophagaceae bacterium]
MINIKSHWFIPLSLIFFSLNTYPQSGIYNILDFGAKADGNTINTTAINKAIETCNSKGGGTVVIPPGNFVSGTVILLSDVELYLSPGAVLTGSKDTTDYLLNKNLLCFLRNHFKT